MSEIILKALGWLAWQDGVADEPTHSTDTSTSVLTPFDGGNTLISF